MDITFLFSSTRSPSLGLVEASILRAVSFLPQPYGVAIREHLLLTTGKKVALGQIYTSLDRMTAKGLVRSELSSPEPVRGGRSKRVYALTDRGSKALEEFTATVAMIADRKENDRGQIRPQPAN